MSLGWNKNIWFEIFSWGFIQISVSNKHVSMCRLSEVSKPNFGQLKLSWLWPTVRIDWRQNRTSASRFLTKDSKAYTVLSEDDEIEGEEVDFSGDLIGGIMTAVWPFASKVSNFSLKFSKPF